MIWALVAGMILDALLGEPRTLWDRWPHPAVLMGRAVAAMERRVYADSVGRGALAYAALAAGALALGLVLALIPGWWVEALCLAALLAQRSLVEHVAEVADALRLSVAEGRRMVARIVGRETARMDAPAVARAAIESAAENFSDGVVAPVFWYLLGGLPGLLLYKITNTADSMIGYRSERYERFGKAAARADDLLNWLPARLTALAFRALGGGPWRDIAADARRHRSPNAGWPEAALSRVLGVRLSGPRAYGGRMEDHPVVNAAGREAVVEDVGSAVALLWQVWAVALGLFALAALAPL